MVGKTKQGAYQTKQQLLAAAAKLFSCQGLNKTSLNDIAREAGLTRGAIYWHFKNKAELFNELWNQFEADFDCYEQQLHLLYPDDPLTVIKLMVINVLERVESDPRHRLMMEVLLHKCEFSSDELLMHKAAQFMGVSGYERIENSLKDCVARNQLPALLDTQTAAIVFRSFVCGLLGNWLSTTNYFSLKDNAPLYANILIDMLTNSTSLQRSVLISQLAVT